MKLNRNHGAGFVMLMLAAAPTWAGETTSRGKVTFARDVAPILYANCVSCHRPDQIGPMSLLTFEQTRPWAKSIKASVQERSMPPWHADPRYGKFKDAMGLTDEEIETLVAWVDSGRAEGDRADLPPTPEFGPASAWLIGQPDQVFTMEPYEVSDELEDHYEWAKIENNLGEDHWVKAVELHPDFFDGVHHILVFLGPKGATPREAEGGLELFGKWAPGMNPDIYPEGHGKLLPADDDIFFQVHYHKEPGPGTGGTNQSSMGVIFAEGEVEHPVTTAWILDPSIRIPAGAEDFESVSVFRFIDDGHIFSLAPHMHLRGKSFQYIADYPDGTSEILLSVPKWNFDWQRAYFFEKPKFIPKRTAIRAIAHYDNSANNPDNPDPTIEVDWGEATTDEMMIGFMDYTYVKRKKFQRTFALPDHMAEDGFFGGAAQGRRNRREANVSGGQ